MNRVKLSLRITKQQEAIIAKLAASRGMSRYQASLRALETGLSEIDGQIRSADHGAIDLIGQMATRLERLERMVDRVLLVTSTGYVFSRQSALRGEIDFNALDQSLGDAGSEAYLRQLSIARGE